MNTRDPFNHLRKASPLPLTLLRNATHAANNVATSTIQTTLQNTKHTASVAIENSKQAFESSKQAIESAREVAADMSFAVPRNVPNFDTAQRKFEDNVWNKFTGSDNKGLPMYKDKPSGYGAARRGGRKWYSGKRGAGVLIACVFGLLYWLGMFGTSVVVEEAGKKGADRWKEVISGGVGVGKGKKGKKVDWDVRREAVRDAFLASWKGYEEHGWGYDEYHPVSKNGRYMAQPNGLGWIIVDALDTMMIMNLTKELKHAREWISTTLDYEKNQDVNTFETTIRMLGGFLSAHYLQEALPGMKPANGNDEDLFLEKATDLADRLIGAYDSPSGIPWASVILKTGKGEASHADGGASSTAEATTLQLEMKYLAYLTGEDHYWKKAEKVMEVVDNNGAKDGLVPIFIYADKGTFRDSEIRLGSRGDSYYEYLIKQYYQTQKQEPVYLDMWNEALEGVKKHLVTYSKEADLTIIAERPNGLTGRLHPKMDHLVCFMPGTIALAATGGLTVEEAKKLPTWGKQQEEDMQLARELTKTCMGMYRVTATGLAPEIAHFELHDPPKMYKEAILPSKADIDVPQSEAQEDAAWKSDYVVKPADSHNLQRPETVESLFYMWRITGDELYRNWGWEMFEAFVKHTMIGEGEGFTSVGDVNKVPPPRRDNMESFWLAETLKYFYLLFGPNDILPLDQIVLNTEAHPFPRFDPSRKKLSTGWKRIPRDKEGNLVREVKEAKPTVERSKGAVQYGDKVI